MAKRKPELKSYIVRMRETIIRDYVVDDCKDEQDAQQRVHSDGWIDAELDMPDWEVVSVEENL